MKNLFLLIFLIPVYAFTQNLKTEDISPILNQGEQVTLTKEWKYKVGDKPEWADPDFKDSLWDTLTNANIYPEKLMDNPREHGIVWFRKSLFIDSTINQKLVAKIFQIGASEIYLDGKLINSFGKISNNPDSVVHYNYVEQDINLPLLTNKKQLLAIRFVNSSQPRSIFKKRSNPVYTITIAQANVFSNPGDLSKGVMRGNVTLTREWKFKTGDNPDWANPDFNDSSWGTFTRANLIPENLMEHNEEQEIVWFRKTLFIDSTFNKDLVCWVLQSGASEIFLNGKRIETLGKISDNPDSIIIYNPGWYKLLSFPLEIGKEQILAIRFLNSPDKFPLYSLRSKSYLEIYVSTLQNATNILRQIERKELSMYYVLIGISTIMFILFLALFIFFPSVKINLYFSISNLIMVLFLISILYGGVFNAPTFETNFLTGCLIAVNLLLLYYCFYKIFNERFGVFFWSVFILSLLQIPALFLYDAAVISPLFAVFIFIETIRISIKAIKAKNYGGYIILVFVLISSLFWFAIVLNILSILDTQNIFNYQPFAYALFPISIAIYIAYSFGRINQKLRNKLIEVDNLSREKQQILATQNITLEKQVKERTHDLNQSLENLKSTQSQLIQSEKMASLGELTAGIAHEIQNPLNFVNNFSEVNSELIDELTDEVKNGNDDEVLAIAKDIKENGQKINHHGKRADAIVKGMLQHSQNSTGQKELTDINKLADEYLRLSYHGLRAKDKSFNADFKTEFDETLPKINVIPQDIGRVLLNLINNAFYIVTKKAKESTEEYKPMVTVGTKKRDSQIEIMVTDNGFGIPPEIKDKIFQPFFTTKPTGSGTGLGLSLSYDIVKAHGGKISVDSLENEGTTFIIELPLN